MQIYITRLESGNKFEYENGIRNNTGTLLSQR
jgi:hypothetical protein